MGSSRHLAAHSRGSLSFSSGQQSAASAASSAAASTDEDASRPTHINWQDFGPALRQMRTRLGLTQEEFAKRLGYDRIHISRLENDARHPSAAFLRVVALVCPLTPMESSLFGAFAQMRRYHSDEWDLGWRQG